ncbi:MAG: hypothetical protein JOZ62_15770 [Acidobacteriaceae bacterium]|nr:hypothetical protein [Acidobacteriaceae bacterium]
MKTKKPPGPSQIEQPAAISLKRARLDLSDDALRSDSSQATREPHHELSREHVQVSVVLPFGSPPGSYQFGLFRPDQIPLITTGGNAEVSQGATILDVEIDLTRYPAGQYLVGLKRDAGDWAFHRLTLR